MPRQIDHSLRRREIVEATLSVLAESGARGLSFRAIAARLGGSTTLVTHYFPTQQSLLDEVARTFIERWDAEIAELDARESGAAERLRALLLWMIPTTPEGLAEERSRIHLLEGHLLDAEDRAPFHAWDETIRGYLREHLVALVPDSRVEPAVELLRVITSGVVLSVVESEAPWPTERQSAVVNDVLGLLGLHASRSMGPDAGRGEAVLIAPGRWEVRARR